MYAGKTLHWPEDIAHAFDRYRKLSQATARSIINFRGRRMKKLRAQREAPGGNALPAVTAAATPSIVPELVDIGDEP